MNIFYLQNPPSEGPSSKQGVEVRWGEVLQPLNLPLITRGHILQTAWMLSFPLFCSLRTEPDRWPIPSTLCLLLNTFHQTQAKTLSHSNTNSFLQCKSGCGSGEEKHQLRREKRVSSEQSCCQDGEVSRTRVCADHVSAQLGARLPTEAVCPRRAEADWHPARQMQKLCCKTSDSFWQWWVWIVRNVRSSWKATGETASSKHIPMIPRQTLAALIFLDTGAGDYSSRRSFSRIIFKQLLERVFTPDAEEGYFGAVGYVACNTCGCVC